jgi:acetolactate synthase-1/3 small subunit
LIFAKVGATADQRGHIVELVNIFEGMSLGVGPEALSISLDGSPEKLNDFSELLKQYGIIESQRTGRVALPKLDRTARVRVVNQTKGKAS